MKVSCIIPVYNTFSIDDGKTLEACIKSLLDQRGCDLQIIFIDNNSTDDSLKTLKKYEQKNKNIEVYQEKKAGASTARNKGLKFVKGDFIFFMDSDDLLKKDMIKTALKIAIEKDSDILYSSKVLKVNGEIKPYGPSNSFKYNSISKSRANIFGVAGHLYKTDFVKRMNVSFNFNIFIAEDFLFNIELNTQTDKIDFNLAENYIYIKHDMSTTGQKSDKWISAIYSWKMVLKIIRKRKPREYRRFINTFFEEYFNIFIVKSIDKKKAKRAFLSVMVRDGNLLYLLSYKMKSTIRKVKKIYRSKK
ncbi:MAG: glycosyltransferase family 2 protein [Alphaproteobacteria bacterium]|nr:glycosyltransferase family 2 protein [Alphaproteobacteria bacterium]